MSNAMPTLAPTRPEWSVRTVQQADEFVALADQWRDLYDRCPVATPFQSHAWLESWWRSYGARARMWVVLVYRNDRLVAAAALLRQRRWGLPTVTPIGVGLSDFSDVLIDSSCSRQAARLLATALAQAGTVVDLPEVPPQAAAWALYEAWPATGKVFPAATCLTFPARPMADQLADLSARRAKSVRRRLRRIDESGVVARSVPAGQAAAAVTRLVQLHRRQWRGRGMTSEHARARFLAHLARAVPQLVADGQAVVVEYQHGEQVQAVDLLLVGQELVGAYLEGCDPSLQEVVDINTLYFREALAHTVSTGRAVFSTLRGDEPHKRRLTPTVTHNSRLLLGDLAGRQLRLYALGLTGRQLVAERLRRAPAAGRLAHRARRTAQTLTGWWR